jgi:hypothetical protein
MQPRHEAGASVWFDWRQDLDKTYSYIYYKRLFLIEDVICIQSWIWIFLTASNDLLGTRYSNGTRYGTVRYRYLRRLINVQVVDWVQYEIKLSARNKYVLYLVAYVRTPEYRTGRRKTHAPHRTPACHATYGTYSSSSSSTLGPTVDVLTS